MRLLISIVVLEATHLIIIAPLKKERNNGEVTAVDAWNARRRWARRWCRI
jgi:hypothetical protein